MAPTSSAVASESPTSSGRDPPPHTVPPWYVRLSIIGWRVGPCVSSIRRHRLHIACELTISLSVFYLNICVVCELACLSFSVSVAVIVSCVILWLWVFVWLRLCLCFCVQVWTSRTSFISTLHCSFQIFLFCSLIKSSIFTIWSPLSKLFWTFLLDGRLKCCHCIPQLQGDLDSILTFWSILCFHAPWLAQERWSSSEAN